MGKYKYFVLHCTATPFGREYTEDGIRNIFKQKGWRQVGYRETIHFDGSVIEYIEHNHDDIVQGFEISNGAKGFNSISQHVSYIGGIDSKGVPKDTRTLSQYLKLIEIVSEEIKRHPNIKVIGHNQLTNKKACPSFFVPDFLDEINDKEKLAKKLISLGAESWFVDSYILISPTIPEKNIERSKSIKK